MPARRKFTEQEVDFIIKSYQGGLGATGISKKMGIDVNPIKTVLKHGGIVLRNSSEAAIASITNGHHDISAATKAMHKACAGRKVSEETRAKISNAHKGRKVSKETLEKMSVSGKARGEEVYIKAALTRERNLSHQSPAEIPWIDAFVARKFNVVPQKAIGRYNVDIALIDYLIAVEPYFTFDYSGDESDRFNTRIKYFIECGWLPIIVCVYRPDEDFTGAVDYIEAVAKSRNINEPVIHEKVILADGKPGTLHFTSGF